MFNSSFNSLFNFRNKFFILTAFLILLAGKAFSYGGVMSGQKDLRVFKTEFFEIIYPEKSGATAKLVSENIDQIYREIAAQYGMEPRFKMPVVITPGVECFNAYWFSIPYNHVVLYDTAVMPSVAVYSELVLSTLRHELTHAFTYNMKNEFWTAVDSVLGDGINLLGLNVTVGIGEGATLTSESAGGQGRLNDEYSWQMVKQAKIEGKFPGFRDVSGAASDYPLNKYYYFNGAFHSFLQEKYGMEKYAQWWWRMVNAKNFTASGAFKKVYGIKLSSAWDAFEEWVQVPEMVKEVSPAVKGLKNEEGALYSDLSSWDRGIFYINSSNYSAYILKDGEEKPRKLFCRRYLQNGKISKDGRFVALNFNDYVSGAVKSRTSVFDVEKNRFYTLKKTGMHTATIIQTENEIKLAALYYENLNYKLLIFKLNQKDGKIVSEELEKEIPLGENCIVQSIEPILADEGTEMAFVTVEGLLYRLGVYSFERDKVTFYSPEENISFRDLSFCGHSKVYFSWIKEKKLPSLGYFDLEKKSFFLNEEDLNGGVYFPSKLGEKLVFISKLYKENRFAGFENIDDDNPRFIEVNSLKENETEAGDFLDFKRRDGEVEEFISRSSKYNPFNYWKGIFVPVSMNKTSSYISVNEAGAVVSDSNVYYLPLGVTYGTSDPWNSGIFILSAGYGWQTNSAALWVQYKDGTDTSLFACSVEAQGEFDGMGFKAVDGAVSVSSYIPFGNVWGVSFSGSSNVRYGRNNKTSSSLTFGSGISLDKNNYLYSSNGAGIKFSNVSSFSPGKDQKWGVSFTASVVNNLLGCVVPGDEPLSVVDSVFASLTDLSMTAGVYIPRLIPVPCKRGITFNIPVRLEVSLFPVSNSIFCNGETAYFGMFTGFSNFPTVRFNGEAVLLSLDCQKSIPFLPFLYLNDLRLSFLYKGALVSQEAFESWRFTQFTRYFSSVSMEDAFALRLAMNFTPNFGAAAQTSLTTSVFADVGYLDFVPSKVLPGSFYFAVGINAFF